MNTCKSCDNYFEGMYCNNCGQKVILKRIGVNTYISEILNVFFNYQNGLFISIAKIISKPKLFITEYLSGSTVYKIAPLKLFLIAIVAESLIITKIGGYGILSNFFNSHYWTFMQVFYVLPIMSLMSFLFFKNYKFTLGEHLVINTYLYSIKIVINNILFLLMWLFPLLKDKGLAPFTLLIIYIWFYVSIFNRKKFLTFIKTILIFLLINSLIYIPLVILHKKNIL